MDNFWYYLLSFIDEMGGVVIDVGGANARFGFAGEDMPKAVFSSVSIHSIVKKRFTYIPKNLLS